MKTVKRILSIMLVIAFALSLSSCLALDRAKEHRMIYTDEKKEEIVYKDKHYLVFKAPNDRAFSVSVAGDENYNVTTDDVPVLLADSQGDSATYDEESDIIYVTDQYRPGKYIFDYYDWDNNVNKYYLPEDRYDEYVEKIGDAEFTNLGKTEYDEKSGEDFKYDFIVLADGVSSEVLDALKNKLVNGETSENVRKNGYECGWFYLTTSDGLVISDDRIEIFDYRDSYYAVLNGNTVAEIDDGTADKLDLYDSDIDYRYYD